MYTPVNGSLYKTLNYTDYNLIKSRAESYDFSGKTIVPFATSGISGIGDSGKNIGEIAKGAKVEKGKRFSAGASAEKLGKWAAQYIENT
jgi:hypothetical protein